jgi:hypothetical protein
MYCAEAIRAKIGLQHQMIRVSDGAAEVQLRRRCRSKWINASAELLLLMRERETMIYRP